MELDLHQAPCRFCGYNGPNYFSINTHHKDCPWYNIGGGFEREEFFKEAFEKGKIKIEWGAYICLSN